MIDLSQSSPMMQHHMETKKEYPDCVLFYRLGDFYEMFFDDILAVSKKLEVTLTGKGYGLFERAPICGVPFHVLDPYLYHLVQKGYRVAIAEQMEDPRQVKGLVKCGVIRVVTPGTITSSQVLDETKNNYLVGIVCMDGIYGISTADTSTGDFMVTEVDSDRKLFDEVNRFSPSEVIYNNAFYVSGVDMDELRNRYQVVTSALGSRFFGEKSCHRILVEHFKVGALAGPGLGDHATGIVATGAVMQYIYETQKSTLEHTTTITPYSTGQCMAIDISTRRDLELVETMRGKQKRGTLLWVLDKTKTAMGVRPLHACIKQPLIYRDEIIKCQNAVEKLDMNYIPREKICEYLSPIYDLECLIERISYKTANPRDLIAFRSSLEMPPYIKWILGEFNSELLAELGRELDPLQDVFQFTEDTIVEEPPTTVREGGIIKDGYNREADELRHAKTENKNWLTELEAKEKEKTGIKAPKIKSNKVFGYYFEAINSSEDQVPDYYIRKQTLANAGRFTTDELRQLEDIIMGAEEKLVSLEYGLFCEVRGKIEVEVIRIQKTAKSIVRIDILCSLFVVATRCNYVKPSINSKGVIQIRDGRHPVVEQMVRNDMFVANDTFLDNGKNRLSIITSPNTVDKSTYMRQVAPIALVTQLGSFVPAQEVDADIYDRTFTRVRASNDLASGQSTLMVEMTEVASILRSTIRNSLLVLDEIGRGTSTFGGLSIAWTVVEHTSNPKLLGAKTLFATHYHELAELEGTMAGVKNYYIAVKEQGDDIVFLRKIVRGGTDKSYGIQVVKLADVPGSVTARARKIVEELSDTDITARAEEIVEISPNITQHKTVPEPDEVDLWQLSFLGMVKDDNIIRELDNLELSTMVPLDTMNTLYRFQTKLKNHWKEAG